MTSTSHSSPRSCGGDSITSNLRNRQGGDTCPTVSWILPRTLYIRDVHTYIKKVQSYKDYSNHPNQYQVDHSPLLSLLSLSEANLSSLLHLWLSRAIAILTIFQEGHVRHTYNSNSNRSKYAIRSTPDRPKGHH